MAKVPRDPAGPRHVELYFSHLKSAKKKKEFVPLAGPEVDYLAVAALGACAACRWHTSDSRCCGCVYPICHVCFDFCIETDEGWGRAWCHRCTLRGGHPALENMPAPPVGGIKSDDDDTFAGGGEEEKP